jgi:hypothetical protein
VNWVSPGSLLNDRIAFIEEFFPKWNGFCVGSFDSEIKPLEALEQLHCLVQDISNVWTVDKTERPCFFPVRNDLNISEVSVASDQTNFLQTLYMRLPSVEFKPSCTYFGQISWWNI